LQEAQEPGPIEAMPIRAVLRQDRVPLAIYWAP
jgi:6-phosphogluconolactonase